MKIPAEDNSPEKPPMATEQELDDLILHAGQLFNQAFDDFVSSDFVVSVGLEPSDFDGAPLGVTLTEEELKQYPTLQQWNKGEVHYERPKVNEDVPLGDPNRMVQPASLMMIFTVDTNEKFANRRINLTPSFVEGEALSEEELQGQNITTEVPRAEVQDIAAILGATIAKDRLDFPEAYIWEPTPEPDPDHNPDLG